MVMDWNQYHKEIGARVAELMKLSPDTVRGYQMLSAAGSNTNHLDEKTCQLISLAIAVITHCDGCIVVHTDAALKGRRNQGSNRGSARGRCQHERRHRAYPFGPRARCRQSQIRRGSRLAATLFDRCRGAL